MKLLKFSLLMNYFAIAKNSKRAIFIINIGIFLSIFAFSAATISIFIENKVSQLEFEHIENSRFKNEMQDTTGFIISFRNKIRQAINSEETHEQYIEFLRLNNFGKAITSPNDLQAYSIYDFVRDKDFILEFALFLKEEIDYETFTEEDKKKIKLLIIKLEKTFKAIEKLDAKVLKKIVYDRSYQHIGDEIIKSLKSESRYKFLKDQGIYEKEYNLITKLVDDLEELFNFFLTYSNSLIVLTDENLKAINEEIIILSSKEKNIILAAFFLQLLIFIIIQFFEISSLKLHLNKRKKL